MARVSTQWIDRVPGRDSQYWHQVRFIASQLGSDGCTGVPDFYLDACLEHDIHWRRGRTIDGFDITTKEANTRFRKVIQSRSKLGLLSPMSWWRWIGVSISARFLSHQST